MSHESVGAREIALAFMSATMTRRLEIARSLLVAADLPERNDAASLEILRRVKRHDLVGKLAEHLGLHHDGNRPVLANPEDDA